MNKLIKKFLDLQVSLFMLFGYKPEGYLRVPQPISHSILSRIKGRLGYKNDLDLYGIQYGVPRKKVNEYIFESNSNYKKRIIAELRTPKGFYNGR